MDINDLKSLAKDEVPTLSRKLNPTDIRFLVHTLDEKDDTLRYNAFLLLQSTSRSSPSTYEYWGVLEDKLESNNSYQRSLGAMLIAENVRWDREDKFSEMITKYLGCCNDEKFITARQAIQGLQTVLTTTDKFDSRIENGLAELNLSKYKENQQKLICKDISNVLKVIKSRKK